MECATSKLEPFTLEETYRRSYDTTLFDLSSSSPAPHSIRSLHAGDGTELDSLLDIPLDYERGGGSGELRELVASLYESIAADHVLITAGASEAIRAVAMATVRPGDNVVVQSPCYAALRQTPAQIGANVHEWRPRHAFEFNFADLGSPEWRDASSIFVNYPHSPSGTILRGTFDGPGRIIADEVYRPIELVPGTKPRSVVDTYDGAVSIGDLSKPLGVGGLRIGWVATRDRGVLRECSSALDYLSGSVSALSSRVAEVALRQFDWLLAPQAARARRNLSELADFVEHHSQWLDWMPPQAGYTAFVRYRSGAPGEDLYGRLRERGVFALGGQVYGEPDHVRIGFGLDQAAFSAALRTFGDELRRLPASPLPPPDGDVILLAKEPRAGFTKTRLAAHLGAETAARLSDAFLRQSLALARPHARRLYLSFAPSSAADFFQSLAPDARSFAQPEGDLGQRLLRAFETALTDGAETPVLIGSDSPTLPSHLLRLAQRSLLTHDVVLGPAEDGGYYLIGVTAPHPELFDGVDWGGERVLRQTLSRAADCGLSVATLPYWYDIDTEEDLARLEGVNGRVGLANWELAPTQVGAR